MLWEIIDPSYLKTKIDNLDLSISGLRDALRGTGNKTLTDLDTDLTNIYGKLDVNLSTRLSESAFTSRWDAGIYGWDGTTARKIKTDANGELQVDILTMPSISIAERGFSNSSDTPTRALVDADRHVQTDVLTLPNPPNLDVALSTRASETTLSGIKSQTDKLTFDATNYLQVNVKATVNPSNLDIALSALRDALRGTGNKTLTDLDTDLTNIYGRLDVALSTRASDSTLSTLSGKFPSAVALADNLSNPTTTIIGGALLGFDGTYWRRVRVDTSGRLAIQNEPNLDVALSTRLADSKIPNALAQISKDIAGSTVYGLAVIASLAHDITRMPYMVDDISVTTTESSTSISAPGAKVVKITNKGDVDCLVGINASVPTSNPLKVRARTAKIFLFGGATAIYYKTASGTTTISIEYFN